MNAQQRSRWRTLAEAELVRGNLLAPVVLDCLDELDTWDARTNFHFDESRPMTADEATVPTSFGPVPVRSATGNLDVIRGAEVGYYPTPPPTTFPAPAPSVDAQTLRHDLDPGPQDEEIETNLGPEPELGDHNQPFF